MRKGIISEDFIQRIDITNTLNGGVSEPSIKISQKQDYRQIEVKVPGISEENMHVKINNNQLIVFYNYKIESNGRQLTIPVIVYNKPIPYFIAADRIHAQFSYGVLTVQLPFNELANGYHRDVPIDN